MATVSKLLQALDLRGTGAEHGADRELDMMRRDANFQEGKDDLLKILGWVIGAMRDIEENERQKGLRPNGLTA